MRIDPKTKDVCCVVFGTILLICVFSLIGFAAYKAVKDSVELKELINNSLGKEIFIKNDTLTIVNYHPGGF